MLVTINLTGIHRTLTSPAININGCNAGSEALIEADLEWQISLTCCYKSTAEQKSFKYPLSFSVQAAQI